MIFGGYCNDIHYFGDGDYYDDVEKEEEEEVEWGCEDEGEEEEGNEEGGGERGVGRRSGEGG